MQLLRDNLTTSTSDQEPAKTDEPVTTEAASVLEPAEDENADKALEPVDIQDADDPDTAKQSAFDCC